MSKRVKVVVLSALALAILVGLPALAEARAVYTVSKPKLSAAPVVGVPCTVSGVIRPKATTAAPAVVKIKLYAVTDGHRVVIDTYRAKLRTNPGTLGSAYSRRITVATEGRFALRAFHYRAGRLVKKSEVTSFDVQAASQKVYVDSNVNGWLAPALRDTPAPADTPLDIVFSTPADWATGDSEDPRPNGAAHFIWGDFEKVGADGLVWHTDGLSPGRYDWMRDAMPKWGTGCLVVTQEIKIDQASHEDTHALPYLPADVDFGDVSAEGMGCNRSIAFLTRVFTQSSADPLVWHTAGLTPGSYDWKCWMEDCHHGTLVADAADQVTIPSDPDETFTSVAADTPLDIVFTGEASSMMCWRTMYFTTAGDFTKTRSYPDPLTWHTGGLAPGAYEWQCWMGPQCHHGTVVVE